MEKKDKIIDTSLKKFQVLKIEKELLAINADKGINCQGAVQLIVNNLRLYNEVIDQYRDGDASKLYLIYQINGQIFKQLKEFNILPSSKLMTANKEDQDGFDD